MLYLSDLATFKEELIVNLNLGDFSMLEGSIDTFLKENRHPTLTHLSRQQQSAMVTVFTDENDNPWWVAKEVCDILGLDPTATRRLDEDEKNTLRLAQRNPTGGNPVKTIINESGLYNLVLRSRKPQALEFKRWINHEVLPTIRKTGGYIKDAEKMSDVDIPCPKLLALGRRCRLTGTCPSLQQSGYRSCRHGSDQLTVIPPHRKVDPPAEKLHIKMGVKLFLAFALAFPLTITFPVSIVVVVIFTLIPLVFFLGVLLHVVMVELVGMGSVQTNAHVCSKTCDGQTSGDGCPERPTIPSHVKIHSPCGFVVNVLVRVVSVLVFRSVPVSWRMGRWSSRVLVHLCGWRRRWRWC